MIPIIVMVLTGALILVVFQGQYSIGSTGSAFERPVTFSFDVRSVDTGFGMLDSSLPKVVGEKHGDVMWVGEIPEEWYSTITLNDAEYDVLYDVVTRVSEHAEYKWTGEGSLQKYGVNWLFGFNNNNWHIDGVLNFDNPKDWLSYTSIEKSDVVKFNSSNIQKLHVSNLFVPTHVRYVFTVKKWIILSDEVGSIDVEIPSGDSVIDFLLPTDRFGLHTVVVSSYLLFGDDAVKFGDDVLLSYEVSNYVIPPHDDVVEFSDVNVILIGVVIVLSGMIVVLWRVRK